MVKTMLDAVDQANNGQQDGVELKEKKKKKKHKNKDKDILLTENEKADENLNNKAKDTECTENKESNHSKKKKKKKSKQDNEHNINETIDSSHSYDSAQTNGTSVMDEIETSVQIKKSKKRKKQKLEQEMDDSERCAQEAHEQENIDDKKKQGKKHRLQVEQTILTCETVDRVGDEVNLNDLLNTVEGEVSSNKHKKKKKRKHTEDSNVPTQTDSSNNYLDIDSESKGVKRKHDEVNPLEEVKEPKKKHKKKKRSRLDQVIDSKELEVENKEKIEKEEKVKQNSDIHNNTKTESPLERNANGNNKGGQWQTADFGDTERQNKFMKLLGGQKPGANKSHLQAKFKLNAGVNNNNMRPNNSEAAAPMPNMAMNKTQERMYKIALENQFVKAQDFNINRGVGLGFQADNKGAKKFHIDVFKSKSVKFDD